MSRRWRHGGCVCLATLPVPTHPMDHSSWQPSTVSQPSGVAEPVDQGGLGFGQSNWTTIGTTSASILRGNVRKTVVDGRKSCKQLQSLKGTCHLMMMMTMIWWHGTVRWVMWWNVMLLYIAYRNHGGIMRLSRGRCMDLEQLTSWGHGVTVTASDEAPSQDWTLRRSYLVPGSYQVDGGFSLDGRLVFSAAKADVSV